MGISGSSPYEPHDKHLNRTLDQLLEAVGKDGWELVGFTPGLTDSVELPAISPGMMDQGTTTSERHKTRAVFKRPVE